MIYQEKLPEIKIEDLFEARVHFGHKTYRWNPKMEPYIYGEQDKTHIVDLRQTVGLLREAIQVLYEIVKKNGKILFVGTTTVGSDIIKEAAQKCGQYYVNHRWLGGTLTNWSTISKSIKTMEKYEKIIADQEENPTYTKKETLDLTRKLEKLEQFLGGIRYLGGVPDLLVVFDTRKDRIAIQEAKKLNIPIIGILDTNSNPDNITHIIPGNDDSARSIQYFSDIFVQTILIGIEEALTLAGVDVNKTESTELIKTERPNKRIIKYKNSRGSDQNLSNKKDLFEKEGSDISADKNIEDK